MTGYCLFTLEALKCFDNTSFRVKKGEFMFNSLADQIRHDEHLRICNNERFVRWLVVTLVSVVIFGGLYIAIQLM